jgi:hypothetical protein
MKERKPIEQENAHEEVFVKHLPPRFYGEILAIGYFEAR